MTENELIRTENLVRIFKSGGSEVHALDGVSFAIDRSAWEVTEKEMRNENGLSFSFLTYIRK